jgi:hypothetical protein
VMAEHGDCIDSFDAMEMASIVPVFTNEFLDLNNGMQRAIMIA